MLGANLGLLLYEEVSVMCVSAEFDSKVEIGTQGICVEYYLSETQCEWGRCGINIEAGGLNTFYYFSNY